jgi:hypothetical protein
MEIILLRKTFKIIDDKKDDCIVVNALDLVLDAPIVLDLNGKAHAYDEYKEQVFLQHIVVDEPDKHNEIVEGYQQPAIFMVTEANQQIYENILPISHEQSEPDYGSHTSEVEVHIEKQAKVTMFGYQSTYFFYDPIAIYMESFFSEVFSLAKFQIKEDGGCKYVLEVKILLHTMRFSLILFCIQGVVTVSWMLSWLHWKHDFT